MARFIDYISDIAVILKGSKMSKDSRISDSFILSRINAYRSKEIRDSYSRNGYIDPSVIQDLGVMQATPVTSNEDPTVPKIGMILGRINIPQVVEIGDEDKGIVRVSHETGNKQFYKIPINRFFDMVEGTIKTKFCYVFRIGSTLYVNPFEENIRVFAILDSPEQGFFIDTTYQKNDSLVYKTNYTNAEQYIVVEGGIKHNGVQYNQGSVFTAVNQYYDGNGKVKLLNQKRRLTLEDYYPMSYTMFETIMMKILTKDFQVEEKEIPDLINDNQDQLNVIKQKNN